MKFSSFVLALVCFFSFNVFAQNYRITSLDFSVSKDKKTTTYLGDVKMRFTAEQLLHKHSKLIKYDGKKIVMEGDVILTLTTGMIYADKLIIDTNTEPMQAFSEQIVFRAINN